MASKCQIAKTRKTPKYSSRIVRRCELTGRARGNYRKFRISRIMLRELALLAQLPQPLGETCWGVSARLGIGGRGTEEAEGSRDVANHVRSFMTLEAGGQEATRAPAAPLSAVR